MPWAKPKLFYGTNASRTDERLSTTSVLDDRYYVPWSITGTHFCYRLRHPRAVVQPEGLCQWRVPVIPMGIEPHGLQAHSAVPQYIKCKHKWPKQHMLVLEKSPCKSKSPLHHLKVLKVHTKSYSPCSTRNQFRLLNKINPNTSVQKVQRGWWKIHILCKNRTLTRLRGGI